jgi:hypothetical protein
MDAQPNQVQCPKCNSTQITANKKGFSAGKALAGDLLLGPVGLLAGASGSNKIIITCLNCGNQFKPGDKPKPSKVVYKTLPGNNATLSQRKTAKILGIIFSVICIPLTILMFGIGEIGMGVFFTIISLVMLLIAVRKVSKD